MRVLITLDSNVYHEINGLVISVLNLCQALEQRGHEVLILDLSDSRKPEEDNRVISMPSVSIARIYPQMRFRLLPVGRRQMNLILDWKPDLVHSQNETSTFSSAKKIARKLGIPLVQTHHTSWKDYMCYVNPCKPLGDWIVKVVLRDRISRFCTLSVAPSRKLYDTLMRYGVKCPVRIVPSGIDTGLYSRRLSDAEIDTIRQELGIPHGLKIALYLGRVAREKNLDTLLDLWKKAGRQDAVLVIAGFGPKLDELRLRVRRLGLEGQVFFTGLVRHDETWKYYAFADFFVCASETETQGLTYVEAIASGLPVLAMADLCLEDVLVDGVNGWMFHDEGEFVAGLERMLGREWDRETVAATVTGRFSRERFAENMERVYLDALSRFRYRESKLGREAL